jgi:3-hydroxyisobutyrate dehydrogenase-like beta-hydroxyacid dehydrogenase
MVSDDIASRRVWMGESGALASARPGVLLIESSSLSVSWARELAGIAKERGSTFVDAPVRGGPSQARAAQLNFLVGGETEAFERARPILGVMGANITHLGAAGNGAAMKLINNMMIAVEIEVFEEALALAERIGLDVNQAAVQLCEGAPGSRALQGRMQDILTKDFTSRFALRLMHKDMSYALDESVRLGVPLPSVAASREIYRLAIARGMGEWDFAGVGEALKG